MTRLFPGEAADDRRAQRQQHLTMVLDDPHARRELRRAAVDALEAVVKIIELSVRSPLPTTRLRALQPPIAALQRRLNTFQPTGKE